MSENICSCHDCEREVYKDSDKCVLHCKKKDYSADWNSGLLLEFYKALRDFLENKSDIITLIYIAFPSYDERDGFNYLPLLEKFRWIHFNYCEFYTDMHMKDDMQCFFQDCKFYYYWTLYPWKVLENANDVMYQCCIFYEDVSPYSSEKIGEEVLYKKSQFDYTCKFKKGLRFNNIKFKQALFYSAQNNFLKEQNFISILTFNNCIFEQPFKLNNYKIEYFICEDTVFKNKSKFEFKNNEIDNFEVLNTNFKALVDCFQTEFKTFKVEKSIFEKFTGFEQCQFGEDNNKERNEAKFQYATFLDFVNFREAKFYNGLDLQNANLKEYPNFLDVYVEPKNTNRETFRIIKHSFDKVGNLIEANKFFADEMNKEREAISIKENFNKKSILNLNYWISNFGQSWVKPLVLIFFVAIFHTFLVYAIDSKIFQFIDSSNSIYSILKWLVEFSNDMAKNILPFKKILVKNEGMEFISLIFLIFYSILIYNLIIAVKRMTKR